jgi:signal transduction histidine kinase
MSHELRTPLNAVIGFARQLRRNRGGALAPIELTYVDRIERSGLHLLSVIDDILDASSLQNGQLPVVLEPVDLARLVRDTVETLVQERQADHVRLAIDVPPVAVHALADRTRLRQVLRHLACNALKFTREGEVRVALTSDDAAHRIEIRDTGIGIPAGRLAHVFDAFEQAEGESSRRFEGSGLGLAISRALCDGMGATLELESEVGVGTVARVVVKRG